MSETPNHEDVKADLVQKVEAEDSGLDLSEELEAEHQAELAAGNITHLRSFLVAQEGEDAETLAAEQTALREAVAEVAEEHEVSETLIMTWINGQEISDQMVGLHERGIRTFRDLREDEDAVRTIQQIGLDLGLDLGEEGVNGDYNDATEEAMRQLQAALVEAGYDLGEFGPNNDGIDGAIGQVSMNIMMNAAKSVAPDEVVEDAIAEAAGEDRSVERRTNEFNAIGVDGDSTPRTGEISEEHIDEYASVLARGMEGVQYDSEAKTFTHTLTDETLAVADVISGNYEDVDRSAMQSSLADFSTEQVSGFATEQGVEVVDHEGNPHFEDEGRMMSVDDILSDQEPLAMFERWQSGEIEGVETEAEEAEAGEIPTTVAASATAAARSIHGVRNAGPRGDNWSIELFDNHRIPLAEVFNETTQELDVSALQEILEPRAQALAAAMSPALTFNPEVGGADGHSAHFTNAEGEIVAFLDEIATREPSTSPQTDFDYESNLLAAPVDRVEILNTLISTATETSD